MNTCLRKRALQQTPLSAKEPYNTHLFPQKGQATSIYPSKRALQKTSFLAKEPYNKDLFPQKSPTIKHLFPQKSLITRTKSTKLAPPFAASCAAGKISQNVSPRLN